MKSTHESNGSVASTLANGLKVLEFVSLYGKKKGVTLQDITNSLEMHRSNVFRYLKTLVNCGWLEYDTETYRYHIGIKPLQIAGSSLNQLDLRAIAHPFLKELVDETCLAIHLGVLNGSSIVYIDKVENNSPIQMRSRPGMMAPVHCTAMGKAMLATCNTQTVVSLIGEDLHRYTPHTITNIEDLLEELKKIQECGYAIDNEENEMGIGCVAAAIFGYEDDAIGAVSLSTLIQFLTPENIGLFSSRVMKTASRISQSMGSVTNRWPIGPENLFGQEKGTVMIEREVDKKTIP